MAHTGGGAARRSAADISYSRLQRYRAEYDAAHADAAAAAEEFLRCLASGGGVRAVADASRRVQFAAARLHTAAACLISPP